MWVFSRYTDSFAAPIGQRTKIAEVSVLRKAEEPDKLEGRVVCETLVERGTSFDRATKTIVTLPPLDMLNGFGKMHGACSVFLIDMRVTPSV
jgi:acyl-coenzyme A thioesterase 13